MRYAALIALCLLPMLAGCATWCKEHPDSAILAVLEADPWSGLHWFDDLEFLNDLAPIPNPSYRIGIAGLGDDAAPVLLRHDSAHTVAISTSIDGDPHRTGEIVPFTDRGLEVLAEHPSLLYLSINFAAITDKGLESVARIPQLRMLKIAYCNVTPEGIAALQERRPDLRIEFLYMLEPEEEEYPYED
jgi:hypothetical protein